MAKHLQVRLSVTSCVVLPSVLVMVMLLCCRHSGDPLWTTTQFGNIQ